MLFAIFLKDFSFFIHIVVERVKGLMFGEPSRETLLVQTKDADLATKWLSIGADFCQRYDVTTTRKNPAAVALGRLGGLKGGNARAKNLTAKRRTQIAKDAAAARWRKKSPMNH